MNRFILAVMLGLACNTAALAQTSGNAEAGRSKTAVCSACHGLDGNTVFVPGAARLGGQHEKYLLKQLQEIKSGDRPIPLMAGQLNNFNDQDLADIAAYFASQELPLGVAQEAALELGQTLYRAGNPDIGVAACSACHSPTGSGNAGAGYPALSGQDAGYTETQLRAFRDGSRTNDVSEVMRSLVGRLNDVEIQALASYVAGLRAE